MKPSLTLVVLLTGIGFTVASWWIVWDWWGSYLGFLNWDTWYARWKFDLPFYLGAVYPSQHSIIFDMALLFAAIGTLLTILAAFQLGSSVRLSEK